MTKIQVIIEEHLSKTITFELPDTIPKKDRIPHTLDLIKELYKNAEIVLTADDYNGTTLVKITDENVETNFIPL